MRRRSLASALALTALLASSTAGAPPGWDPERFLPVEEIRPGMTGVGRSVFRGSAIEEFEVEILGVLPTAVPGGDMILARVSGQGLEKTGVIAGMSGSPIFIDGKLIGALAFGWSFATEPITGITPIADMLALRDRRAGPGDGIDGSGGGGAAPRGGGLDPETWASLWEAQGADVLDLLLPPQRASGDLPAPLRTPVSVGGLGPVAAGEAERWLSGFGFLAVPGGGSRGTPPDRTLEPGSAVGVELVRGDAQLAAVGTVTWVEGDEVFAFGHPMLARGGAAYPLTHAEIVTVMPRASSSFKMGVAGAPAGAVTRDYRAGITASLGAVAPMVPLAITARFGERATSHRFEVLDASGLTPGLTGLMAVNVMDALGPRSGETTLRIRTEMDLQDGRSISHEAVAAGFSPPMELAGEVARLVGIVHGNPDEVVALAGIRVEVEVEERIAAAFLERLEVAPGRFQPGETLTFRAWFRDYRGEAWSHQGTLEIPATVRAGVYELLVCDGSAANGRDRERAPAVYAVRDLDRTLELLGREHAGDALVARLLDGRPHPIVGGRELPALPPSLRGAVTAPVAAGRASVAQGMVVSESVQRLDRVLVGCGSLPVQVEEPR